MTNGTIIRTKMAFLSRCVSVSAALLLLCQGGAYAFTAPANHAGRTLSTLTFQRPTFVPTSLAMAEEGSEKISVKTKSGKEIGYDETTGRFYETGREGEECAPTEGEYCAVDQSTGKLIQLTIEEKERIFLDSLQSYYASGRQLLSDAEFDLLKEDLQWNGSQMVVMNRKEVRFLSAVQAYLKGQPMISDEEYNTLKAELREEGSKFAVSREPVCYIDTGVCKATFTRDAFRSNLLYLPVGALLTIVWLGLGYELIEPIIRLNPILLILLGSYPIYKGTVKITEDYVFQDFKVAYGPCPACGAENRIYFGDILFVEGFKDVADIKCKNCKTEFKVQRNTLRASTLPKA